MKQSSAQLARWGSHVFLHLFRIFQFDAQQAESEIKGSYVSSTQTSLPEQASVRELSFSKREASPPQTTQSHFCLPACEGVCVLCVSASEGWCDASHMFEMSRKESFLFAVCVCVWRNLLLRNIYEPVPFLKKKKKESVVFNEHVLEIVSASIIYKVRLHLWTGLVCKCEYLIIMKKKCISHRCTGIIWHFWSRQIFLVEGRCVCLCPYLVCVFYGGGFSPIVSAHVLTLAAFYIGKSVCTNGLPYWSDKNLTRVHTISHVAPNYSACCTLEPYLWIYFWKILKCSAKITFALDLDVKLA